MKNNIPREKNTLSGQIKNLITLYPKWIPQEDTFLCSRSKLRSMIRKGRSKTQAAKKLSNGNKWVDDQTKFQKEFDLTKLKREFYLSSKQLQEQHVPIGVKANVIET